MIHLPPALCALVPFAAALALTGCATEVRKAVPLTPEEQRQRAPFSYWKGDGVNGKSTITIDLSDQAAYFYKGGILVGRSRVASGKSGFATPTGSFKILEKKKNKESNLYGRMYDASGNVVNRDADIRTDTIPEGGRFDGADMPYWMRLTGSGIGMHAGPIPNPGRPASHGCVRLPRKMAIHFFEEVNVGTPVKVVP